MKARLRRIFLVLAILFVLLLAVPFLIPAERWKNLAIEQLEARTGWQAEAEDARVSLFPVGLRLSKISIEDPDGDATLERFSVRADGVVLRADLASVLRRAPNLQELRFDKPEIELWMRTTEKPIESSQPPSGEAPPAAVAEVSGVSSLLAFVALEEGRVVVHDSEQTVELNGIDQRAQLRLAGDRFELELQGSLDGGSIQAPELPAGRFELPALELELQLSGALPAERVEATSWTLRALGQEMTGDAQIELLPSARVSFSARLVGNVETLYAALAPQMPPLPPVMDGLELKGGELQMQLASSEAIDFAKDSDRIAELIEASGQLTSLELTHLGETLHCEQAAIAIASGNLTLRDLRLALPGLEATAVVTTSLEPQSDLQTTAQLRGDLRVLRALAARVLPRLPEELRADTPPTEEWPGAAGLVKGSLRATLPTETVEDPTQLDLELRLDLAGAALLLPAWRDSVKLSNGELIASASHADLRGLRCTGPGFAGTATGQLWGWPERIESEWDLAFDTIDLDLLQAATTPAEDQKAWLPDWIQGTAYAADSPELAVPPANLGADLRISAVEVHSKGYRLSDLSGRASLHEQKLTLSDANAKLGSGTVDLVGEVDWTQEPPQWQGNSKAQGIPAAELLRPFAAPLADAVQTNFSGDIALNGPVSLKTAAVLAALSGQFALSSDPGSLMTEPILGDALSSFLGAGYARFRQLDFRSLTAGLELKGGQLHFDRFVLDGATELRVSGLVGLDGRCDYGLEIRLPKGMTPQLGELQPLAELLQDEEGRISFHVDVDGPAQKPKVQVDMAALSERIRLRAEGKAKDELQNLLDEKGKQAVGGLLDRLKGKGGGG